MFAKVLRKIGISLIIVNCLILLFASSAFAASPDTKVRSSDSPSSQIIPSKVIINIKNPNGITPQVVTSGGTECNLIQYTAPSTILYGWMTVKCNGSVAFIGANMYADHCRLSINGNCFNWQNAVASYPECTSGGPNLECPDNKSLPTYPFYVYNNVHSGELWRMRTYSCVVFLDGYTGCATVASQKQF